MSKTTLTTLEQLRFAIHGVTAPFCCEGSLVPKQPVALVFKDGTKFEVRLAKGTLEQANELKPLVDRCKPARFGHGKQTRYDRTVRDALQLEAKGGAFSVENLDLESAGILEAIRRELLPRDPNPISAELYTVNVYGSGGHFATHKDTPRGEDMFGTLVLCLPSRFSGGRLILRHRGMSRTIKWDEEIRTGKQPNRLYWAAFFGDVDHRIDEVWSGSRVTLTYLLRRGAADSAPRDVADDEHSQLVREALRALLADREFLPEGGTLGYPCAHLYHKDARFQQTELPITQESVTMLKGRDQLTASSALQSGLRVTFNAYMFENCADETWKLDRFPTPKEKSRLRSQMDSDDLKRLLPILASSEDEGDFGVTWIEPPPTSAETAGSAEKGADEDADVGAAAAHLHSCEYCPWGYFGNEASEIDLYTYAALHVEVPPAGEGPRKLDKPAKPKPVKGKRAAPKRKKAEE